MEIKDLVIRHSVVYPLMLDEIVFMFSENRNKVEKCQVLELSSHHVVRRKENKETFIKDAIMVRVKYLDASSYEATVPPETLFRTKEEAVENRLIEYKSQL